jgi:outer membrane murein-binding lipoprotein Lpp
MTAGAAAVKRGLSVKQVQFLSVSLMKKKLKKLQNRVEELSSQISELQFKVDDLTEDDYDDYIESPPDSNLSDNYEDAQKWKRLLDLKEKDPEYLAEIVKHPKIIFLDLFDKGLR